MASICLSANYMPLITKQVLLKLISQHKGAPALFLFTAFTLVGFPCHSQMKRKLKTLIKHTASC